ncbi:hypothetical protein A2714_03360 [Candidatus Woesebacteria bacterium RIFCSPHIGHO2_01_FULL_38_9]|uniref:Cell envelope-related transcriptional attenuator domain-containing protein n=2 Tax=Candidatus Woeseibacteriota TaxID=1752722 RepID=A0A1F7Y060_9BACT|nr:MAG: hypothetical protein A2714_03360 [Candidatus Woesebacteria bacterium RIFCSPHIGHO2_01_FULL_38_9]OGM59684.1 MAG: hypothetical protein A3A75_00870 [Candidatus Woesebacteria bacterium RIFCSPLOWO2_01_FULL_39_10]
MSNVKLMPNKNPVQKENVSQNPVEPEHLPAKGDRRRVAVSRLKRKILKHVWLLRTLVITGLLSALLLSVLVLFNVIKKTQVGFYFSLANDFIFTPSEKIKSSQDRTNILILGKGGGGHEAPDLTDTIILASVNHLDSSISLISLPRDIWIPALRAKLNSIYYWGNKKQDNGGIVLTKATVEEVAGVPVHYAAILDFSAFKTIIDILGGVEVDVERSFTDEKYPIPGKEDDECDKDPEYKCRYETVKFEAGRIQMDGETALKFVRSRNAIGDEGTDFARASRQQKVIVAIKDKMMSREVLLSPKKMLLLKDEILKSVETDVEASSGAILARRALETKGNFTSFVIPEELLENPPYSQRYDNLYVFIPRKKDIENPLKQDWSEIHEWVICVLNKPDSECEEL